jgi:hypothetical protein
MKIISVSIDICHISLAFSLLHVFYYCEEGPSYAKASAGKAEGKRQKAEKIGNPQSANRNAAIGKRASR